MTIQPACPEPLEPDDVPILDANLHLYIDAALDAQDHEPMPDLDVNEFLQRMANRDGSSSNRSGATSQNVGVEPAAASAEDELIDPASPGAGTGQCADPVDTKYGQHPQSVDSSCTSKDAFRGRPDVTNVPRRRTGQTKPPSTLVGIVAILVPALSCVIVGTASAGLLGTAWIVPDVMANVLSAVLGALSVVVAWHRHNLQANQRRLSAPRRISTARSFLYLARRWRRVTNSCSVPNWDPSPTDLSAYDPQLIYHQVREEFRLPVDPAAELAATASVDEHAPVDVLPATWAAAGHVVTDSSLADQVAEYLNSSAAITIWLDHTVDRTARRFGGWPGTTLWTGPALRRTAGLFFTRPRSAMAAVTHPMFPNWCDTTWNISSALSLQSHTGPSRNPGLISRLSTPVTLVFATTPACASARTGRSRLFSCGVMVMAAGR